MSNRISKLFQVSMEDGFAEEIPTNVTDHAAPDEAMLSMVESELPFDDQARKAERLEEAVHGLESIAQALEDDRSTGLSPQAAFYANKAIMAHAGEYGAESACISTEAFSGASRIRATYLSMESIGSKLKELLDALLAILNKVREAAATFLKRLFDFTHIVDKQIDELMTHVDTLEGQPKELKFEDQAVANAIAFTSQVEKFPVAPVVELQKIAGEFFSAQGFCAQMTKLGDDMGKTALSLDGVTGDAFNSKALAVFKFGVRFPESFAKTVSDKDGVAKKQTNALPGGRLFVLEAPSQHNTEGGFEGAVKHVDTIVHKLRFSMEHFEDRGEVDPTLTTMLPHEMKSVLGETKKLVGLVSEYRSQKDELDRERNITVKELEDAAAKAANSELDSSQLRLLQSLYRGFGAVDKVGNIASVKVGGYLVRVAMGYAQYVKKSMAQYTAPAAKPALSHEPEPAAA